MPSGRPVKYSIPVRLDKTYSTWADMKRRCCSKTYKSYPYYGGRGIKVCDRWKNSYLDFLKDMGPKPDGYSIDRINNDGDYCPENCRWATTKQQNRNQQRSLNFKYNGEVKCLSEWCEIYHKNKNTVYYRLTAGWSFEAAMFYPVKSKQELL